MMAGGDAAEQVVRLSLEGLEVAVRISGLTMGNVIFQKFSQAVAPSMSDAS